MSTVILLGAFGQGNPGDEALCSAFCRALEGHEVIVASGDPGATYAAHGRRSIPANAWSVATAMRHADAIVIGGGTIFKRLHRSTGRGESSLLRNTAALIAGARARGIRIAMIGVGADELRGRAARFLCGWMIPRVDLLVLRDEESASVLTDAGVPAPFWIGADPAWTLFDQPIRDDRGLRGRRTITVALSHLAADDRSVTHLVEALRPFAGPWNIRLQPWQHDSRGRDGALARELRARLGAGEIIDAPIDLPHAAATFADDDVVIAMRFHALLAAAAAGVRSVAIAHEPKLAGLARRMEQASVPAHASADVLKATIDWSLTNEPPAMAAIQREVERARHSFELLDLLLNGGAVADPNRIAALPLSTGRGTW